MISIKPVFAVLSISVLGNLSLAKSYFCQDPKTSTKLEIQIDGDKAILKIESPNQTELACDAADLQNNQTQQIVKAIMCGDDPTTPPNLLFVDEKNLTAHFEFDGYQIAELNCQAQ
jgi:hypothetical protein